MASEALDALVKALTEKSWTAGTCQVAEQNLVLFFGKDRIASRLDFTNATQEDLEHLEQTCSPAPFGRGGEDVLDGSYRKAGKLDLTEFSPTFNLTDTSILTHVKADLAQGNKSSLGVKAELYKLNVYGKDGFFKKHKDTPRSQDMFASLVVVFPTPHEGGALELSQNDQFFLFDAASMLAEAPKWSVAYVAFFSDIDHEVATVTSGHRVTLTYNLYFETTPAAKDWAVNSTVTLHPALVHNSALREALKALLKQPEYDLSAGVRLLFGLRHQYPFQNGRIPWSNFGPMLKGSDKALFDVCEDLGLMVDLQVLYSADDDWQSLWLCDYMFDASGSQVEDIQEELSRCAEFVGHSDAPGEPCDGTCDTPYHHENCGNFKVVLDPTLNSVHSEYAEYGNEASVGYLYGNAVLVVSGESKNETESE